MNMYSIGDIYFDKSNDYTILNVYAKAAQDSMKRAANELCGESIDPVEKRVKIDGSWQKRGHNSLNGSVTAVADDKVVDYQAYFKHCKGRKMWEKNRVLLAMIDGKSTTYAISIIQSHLDRWMQQEPLRCFRAQFPKTISFTMST